MPLTAWPVDAVEDGGVPDPVRMVRISAQAYNELGEVGRLADVLREVYGRG